MNPYQSTFAGSFGDAFVTKLSSGGNTLVYSTYLDGSGSDGGQGIAVDGSGKVVLADLGAYQASGRLLSCRDDEMTLQTRSGSWIVVNRQETRSIRELVARGRQA